MYIHPEFVLWATSASGVHASKRSYETLETYGDTILKLAATHLAYDTLDGDYSADEKKINDRKNAFVTNLYLFRIGNKLGLRDFMRSKDSDIKTWSPPFTDKALINEEVTCTGKNIADGVEALIGAFFLSSPRCVSHPAEKQLEGDRYSATATFCASGEVCRST